MSADLRSKMFRIFVVGGSDTVQAREAIDAFRQHVDFLIDPRRAVYRAFGFAKFVGLLQQSGTVLADATGTVRYVHRASNPQKSLHRQGLLEAVESVI